MYDYKYYPVHLNVRKTFVSNVYSSWQWNSIERSYKQKTTAVFLAYTLRITLKYILLRLQEVQRYFLGNISHFMKLIVIGRESWGKDYAIFNQIRGDAWIIVLWGWGDIDGAI